MGTNTGTLDHKGTDLNKRYVTFTSTCRTTDSMDHFDVIINNIDCRKTFSQFFYTSANWTIISNPYKQAVTEEDIPDIDIDLYGVNSASDYLDYDWDELYSECQYQGCPLQSLLAYMDSK